MDLVLMEDVKSIIRIFVVEEESFLIGICILTTCIIDINQTEPVQVPSVGHWSSKHLCVCIQDYKNGLLKFS